MFSLSSLYILDINPLLDKHLAKTFFHSVGCISTPVDCFFCCIKDF
jgi:hypothetical protein